jgi:hypothetical protein
MMLKPSFLKESALGPGPAAKLPPGAPPKPPNPPVEGGALVAKVLAGGIPPIPKPPPIIGFILVAKLPAPNPGIPCIPIPGIPIFIPIPIPIAGGIPVINYIGFMPIPIPGTPIGPPGIPPGILVANWFGIPPGIPAPIYPIKGACPLLLLISAILSIFFII